MKKIHIFAKITLENMLKRTFIILSFLLFSLSSVAQFYVGEPEDVEAFQMSKMLVAIDGAEDNDEIRLMHEVINETWRMTKLEFIRVQDIPENRGKKNCSLMFLEKVSQVGNESNAVYYIQIEKDFLRRKTGYDTRHIMRMVIGKNQLLMPGGMRLYLLIAQYYLKNIPQDKKIRNNKKKKIVTPGITRLRELTLFLPEQMIANYATESVKALEGYEYKYEIMDQEDIDEKILVEDEACYFLYIRGIESSYFIVVNGTTGEVVHRLRYNSYRSIKKNYFQGLSRDINKV